MEASSQMHFLQVDPSFAEMSIESQAIPLGLVLNDQRDHIFVPIPNDDGHVYIDPCTEDHNFFTYIDNCHMYYNGNESNNDKLSSDVQENVSVPVKSVESSIPRKTKHQNQTRTAGTANKVGVENKKKNIEILRFVHLSDSVVPPRAVAVLPSALYLRQGSVVPRRKLPMRVKFGPVKGVNHANANVYEMVLKAAISRKPLYLKSSSGSSTYIDVTDIDKSNWFNLLPLGDQSTANVWLYQEGDELYGFAVRSIASRTPLSVGYSKQYADMFNIPSGQPILDISEALKVLQSHGNDERFLPTNFQQQNIISEDKSKTARTQKHLRKQYRCRYCSHTFSRLFTLKRHVALYCCKNSERIDLSKSDSHIEDGPDNATSKTEDNRLPSDESLQNYSNGLDFSTSLFDTDRIPNLDISGSSRSEADFNPYGITYRDDSSLTSDLVSATNELDKKTPDVKEDNKNSNESFLVTCQDCNQTIARDKKMQHLRECPERRLKCECGLVYKSRAMLAGHIHTCHPTSLPPNKPKEDLQLYQCDKCEQSYMRRGMLVNHLWRVHGSARPLPLRRRVRHYPCVACPKLYRAAGKRDRHVRKHHPGVELVKGSCIDGGTAACEPASCPECPRQYVTRAKMLQHMRAAHPHLAPPKKKSYKAA